MKTDVRQTEQAIYCIGCGQMLAEEPSMLHFRTGFYYGRTPLGACQPCIGTYTPLQMLWRAVMTERSYGCPNYAASNR